MKQAFWIVSFSIAFLGIFFLAAFPLFAATPSSTNSTLKATTPGSDTVPADGVTKASMTATLKDSSGNAIAGDKIYLSAPGDSFALFSPSAPTGAITDATGLATFSAVSTQVGTDAITVTDSTANVNLTALGNIIFTALTPTPTPGPTATPTPLPPGVCAGSTTNPPGTPNLFFVQTASSASTSATLYFVEPQGAFTGFTINYGLNAAANMYATSFTQGTSSGVLAYNINSLTLNTTYFFRIRAYYQCAYGPWSATLSTYIGTPSAKVKSSGLVSGSNIVSVLLSIGGIVLVSGLSLLLL